MMNRKMVLRSSISVGSKQEFIDEILSLAKYKVGSYVCFANVHMVMESYNNPAFQEVVNHSNIVAPDGKPISLFIRAFNHLIQDRICGMDLLPELLKRADSAGKSVYFYGGTIKVLEEIVQKVHKEFPSLQISGSYSPPFRNLSKQEEDEIVTKIKSTSPDLVFVSLGCPKQEKWMAVHKDKLGACLLGVGQAFSTYAGVEKRLPVWMRNFSLEWIYRLYLEPKRLWKRYLFTNSHFLLLTLAHSVTQLRNRLNKSVNKAPLAINRSEIDE